MKSTFQVLKDIKTDWDNMSLSEQQAIAISLAGKNQFEVFSAVLENFDSAVTATETALNSQGSAMRENEAYMSSLQAKITALKAQFQELVLGNGGLSDFTKLLLDAGTNILKFANSDIGQLIIKLGLIVTTVKLVGKSFKSLSTSLVGVSLQLFVLETKTLGLSAAFGSLMASMAPFILPTAIISGIAGIVTTINYLNSSAERSAEKFQELSSEYESTSTELETLDSKLKEVKDTIRELDPITDKEDLENLKEEEASLERQIELLKLKQQELQRQKAEQAMESLNTVYTSDRFTNATTDQMGVETVQSAVVTKITELQRYKQELLDLDNQITQANEEMIKTAEEYGATSQQYKDAESNLNDLKNTYNEVKSESIELSEEVQASIDAVKDSEDVYEDLSDSQKDTIDSTEDLIDSMLEFIDANKEVEKSNEKVENSGKQLSQGFYNISNSMKEQSEALGIEEENLGNLQYSYSTLGSNLSEIQSAYNTLRDAVEEYNETGNLTVGTLDSLLQLNPQYLSALIDENGQLSLNEQTLYNLAEQEKTNAIISLQYAAAKDMEAIASGKLNEASDLAQSAVASMGEASETAGQKAASATQGVMSLAVAMNTLITAAGQDGASEDTQAQMEAVRNEYLKIAEDISNIKIDFSSGYKGSGSKSSKGAAKKAGKKAGDAYKEAYQKELDSLDHDLAMNVISQKEYYNKLQELNERYFGEASGQHEKYLDEYRKNEEKIFKGLQDLYKETADYLEEQFDKKIDELKEAKDAQLEDIDEEIEGIEEVRDKKLEAIDKQIEAIEKERDITLDALKKQKEALEEAQDEELDNIDNQLDSLEEQRDKTEEYWNEKINSIKDANDEIDKQIKLEQLQQALEEARYRKVKVFKDGRFQYVQDESAVEKAEQDLADYQEQLRREQEIKDLENQRDQELGILDDKIKNLEDYKEQVKNNYDQQIEDLEDYIEQTKEQYEKQLEDLQEYYDQIEEKYNNRIERLKEHRKELEEEYDEQIKLYEHQKEKFTEYVNAQEEEQKRQLANELTGLQTENEIWMTRLENLAEFITEYNRLLAKKGEEGESVSSNYKGQDSIGSNINSYAKGTPSVDDNELAVVGENPYREIVIGSTLNKNGSLLKLKKGSGVVNSKATNTLAHNLNELAKFSTLSNFSNSWSNIKNNNSNTQYFNFDKIVLPNVTDGNNFVEVLSTQYRNYVIQSVNSRG